MVVFGPNHSQIYRQAFPFWEFIARALGWRQDAAGIANKLIEQGGDHRGFKTQKICKGFYN